MALTDFAIIRRSMFGRMFSTVTTVLTVAVAVALMLTLLSLRDSGRQAFERGTGNMDFLISRNPGAGLGSQRRLLRQSAAAGHPLGQV
ncbi:MAG: hypothetical protein ACFHWZ_17730 [Phycisphaerales bacterium]